MAGAADDAWPPESPLLTNYYVGFRIVDVSQLELEPVQRLMAALLTSSEKSKSLPKVVVGVPPSGERASGETSTMLMA